MTDEARERDHRFARRPGAGGDFGQSEANLVVIARVDKRYLDVGPADEPAVKLDGGAQSARTGAEDEYALRPGHSVTSRQICLLPL
jgi:hypothetical protein